MGVARHTIARSRSKFPPRQVLPPQRWSRSTTLFILELFAGWVRVVNAALRLFYHRDGTLVPIEEEDERVTVQVRTGAEHLTANGVRTPKLTTHRDWL